MIMKYFALSFVYAAFASSVFAQAVPPTNLQVSLKKLQTQAQKIAHATTNQEKAKAWLALNHQAVKFADEMNRAFPHSSIHGDKISPPEPPKLAQPATSYCVRLDFCEPGGDQCANHHRYL